MKMEIPAFARSFVMSPKRETEGSESKASSQPPQAADNSNSVEQSWIDEWNRKTELEPYRYISAEETSARLELGRIKRSLAWFREDLAITRPDLANKDFDFSLNEDGHIEILDRTGQLSDKDRADLARSLSEYRGFGSTVKNLAENLKQLVTRQRDNPVAQHALKGSTIGGYLDFSKILNSHDMLAEGKKQIIKHLKTPPPAISIKV